MPAATETQIIEGTWEEIYQQAPKFNGHRLRVIILPNAEPSSTEQRLAALNEWLNMSRPIVPPLLDDSRAGIYREDEEKR